MKIFILVIMVTAFQSHAIGAMVSASDIAEKVHCEFAKKAINKQIIADQNHRQTHEPLPVKNNSTQKATQFSTDDGTQS